MTDVYLHILSCLSTCATIWHTDRLSFKSQYKCLIHWLCPGKYCMHSSADPQGDHHPASKNITSYHFLHTCIPTFMTRCDKFVIWCSPFAHRLIISDKSIFQDQPKWHCWKYIPKFSNRSIFVFRGNRKFLIFILSWNNCSYTSFRSISSNCARLK